MDCPICFNLIENSCIGSCTHHFCYKCLIKWITTGGKTCPLCKIRITRLQLDKDFDSINNPFQKLIDISNVKRINIDFNNRKIIPGITLKNNFGPGVMVKGVEKDKAFYNANIKSKMIILFLNGIPCINHKDSIEIINSAYKDNANLLVEILI